MVGNGRASSRPLGFWGQLDIKKVRGNEFALLGAHGQTGGQGDGQRQRAQNPKTFSGWAGAIIGLGLGGSQKHSSRPSLVLPRGAFPPSRTHRWEMPGTPGQSEASVCCPRELRLSPERSFPTSLSRGLFCLKRASAKTHQKDFTKEKVSLRFVSQCEASPTISACARALTTPPMC
jgi:hypothetical protein